MKKWINVMSVAAGLALMSACSENLGPDEYVIEGRVDGLKKGEKVLFTHWEGVTRDGRVDTFTVEKDNRLYIKGTLGEPFAGFIRVMDTDGMSVAERITASLEVFVVPGKMKVSGSRGQLAFSNRAGGIYEEESVRSYMKISDSLNRELVEPYAKIIEAGRNGDPELLKPYYERMQSIDQAMKQLRDNFIENNPGSQYAAFLFSNRYPMDMTVADLQEQYDYFTPDVQRGLYGRDIQALIGQKKATEVGAVAPGFTLTEISGEPVSLLDYRGKYVILDFWASWCGPCRAANPHMVEMYKKYNAKGLEVLGLSRDQSREEWKKAIDQDKLIWKHVFLGENREGQGDVGMLYNVSGIPTTVFVSPEGTILYWGHPMGGLSDKVEEIFAKK